MTDFPIKSISNVTYSLDSDYFMKLNKEQLEELYAEYIVLGLNDETNELILTKHDTITGWA